MILRHGGHPQARRVRLKNHDRPTAATTVMIPPIKGSAGSTYLREKSGFNGKDDREGPDSGAEQQQHEPAQQDQRRR